MKNNDEKYDQAWPHPFITIINYEQKEATRKRLQELGFLRKPAGDLSVTRNNKSAFAELDPFTDVPQKPKLALTSDFSTQDQPESSNTIKNPPKGRF